MKAFRFKWSLFSATTMTLLAFSSINVSAFESIYPSMSIPGTFNDWSPGDSQMVLEEDYTWRIAITVDEMSSFKFTPNANWSIDFGDGNQDGHVDQRENNNIYLPEDHGQYVVRFNDQTGNYQIMKIGNVYSSMYLTGTHNNWIPGAMPMSLTKDLTWQAKALFQDGGRFKMNPFNNWTISIGRDGSNDDDFYVPGAGIYEITYNDLTFDIDMKKISLNVYDSMSIAGTFNNWVSGATPMILQGNSSWVAELPLQQDDRFRFTPYLNSDFSIGDQGHDITVTQGDGMYRITFFDYSESYILEKMGDNTSRYPTMFVSGSHSNWLPGVTPMTLTQGGSWTTTQYFDADAEFKFTPFDNWLISYGIDGGNQNIAITEGAGTYQVSFNDITFGYSLTKLSGENNNDDDMPIAPIAYAGADIYVSVGNSATFNASQSMDANGDIVTYSWSNGLTGVNPTSAPYNTEGLYTVTLTVTDDEGLTDTDVVNVTVGPAIGIEERAEINPALTFPMTGVVGGGSYEFVEPYPSLANEFDELVLVTHDRLTNRIFVVEKRGVIKVFDNDPNIQPSNVKTFLNIQNDVFNNHERGLLGLEFDPDYVNNGYFYIFYVSNQDPSNNGYKDTILERWNVDPTNPSRALPGSKVELLRIEQNGTDHKGGMIKFSPTDGMLYLSVGDGRWAAGYYDNNSSQDRSNLRGSIIRIDPIDTPAGGYNIPSDNPFVGNTLGIKEEIYAYGFRNPWRFEFDPLDGTLYEGDTGQATWEEVNIVESGKNYGWPVCENLDNRGGNGGNGTGNLNCATDYAGPLTAFNQNGNPASMIGGVVYRGSEMPALDGHFIYGDYDTSRIWAIDKNDPNNQIQINGFGTVAGNLSSFGSGPNSEVYVTSFRHSNETDKPRSKIWQLVDTAAQPAVFPATLTATNLFSDVENLVPADGVIEYDVNSHAWQDGAVKRHFIAVPNGKSILFNPRASWEFPVGTAIVKHADVIVDTAGAKQPLQTSVLFKQAASWVSLNYKWNVALTDADLVSSSEVVTLTTNIDGVIASRDYSIQDSSACSTCHKGNRVLGLDTRNLNKDFAYATATSNQIDTWNHIGLFGSKIDSSLALDKFVNPEDVSEPLEARARTYMHTNCAHCHSNSYDMDLRFDTPLLAMGLLNEDASVGSHRIKPFDPQSSGVYLQQTADTLRMPNGSRYTNPVADTLFDDWITGTGATLDSILISVSDTNVNLEDTTEIKATNYYSNGFTTEITGAVSWVSSNPQVIDVFNESGATITATGLTEGQTTITASSGGLVSAAATINVSDGSQVVSLTASPTTVYLNGTQQLMAVATLKDGTQINVNNDATWAVTTGSNVASVSNSGLLTQLTNGDAEVTVTYENQTASVDISTAAGGLWVRYDNTNNWANVYIHIWKDGGVSQTTWPGINLGSPDAEGWYSYFIPEANMNANGTANYLFNNGGNGQQSDDIVGASENSSFSGNTLSAWYDPPNSASSHGLIVIGGATSDGLGVYPAGSSVQVTANVAAGGVFAGWSGTAAPYILGDTSAATVTLIMPDKDIALQSIVNTTGQMIEEGKAIYQSACSSCHGNHGEGGAGPNLQTSNFDTLESLVSKIEFSMPPAPLFDPTDCDVDCAEKISHYILAEFQGKSALCGPEDIQAPPRQIRLLTRTEYNNTVADLLGIPVTNFAAAVPAEIPVHGYLNNAAKGVVSEAHAEAYLQAAEDLAPTQTVINSVGDVAAFAKKAFRRPLTTAEVTRYESVYNNEDGDAAFQAIMSSPYFLYRSEMGVDQGNGTYQLTQYEIATLLSYMYWETTPDATLLAAADNNQLSTPAQIQTQADRLLSDARARNTVGNWVTQWFDINKVSDIIRADTTINAVRDDMVAETQDFVNHVIFDSASTYDELISANYTIASSALANFYGLTPGAADNKVMYSNNQRSGLLGHGSILAAYSQTNEPHPIRRGIFVREHLLCQPLPEAPADVMATFPEVDPSMTLRERFELHRESGTSCESCHRYIDGIGFGFETFDAVGKWRDQQNGFDIDATGNLNYLEGLSGAATEAEFSTLPQLANIIADSQSGPKCFMLSYYRFAQGREENAGDMCSIEQIYNDYFESSMTLRELLLNMTQIDNFTIRQ